MRQVWSAASHGIDYGAKSTVEKVPAGKSVTFECKDGCGVTVSVVRVFGTAEDLI